MKHILYLLIFLSIITSCSSDKNQYKLIDKNDNSQQNDSAYGFKIGDIFLHDSLDSYGFILINFKPELLNFSPVKLDSSKVNIEKVMNGQIRLVPYRLFEPDNGEYGIECLGVMENESMIEFKKKFHHIGNLKIKKPYPNVASSTYTGFTYNELTSFVNSYEMTWEGRSKMIKTTELLK